MRRVIALTLLTATAAAAEPGILLLPAIGTPTGVTVSGRVLKEMPTNGSSTLSKNLRRLTASGWEGAKLKLELNGVQREFTSTGSGDFTVTFAPALTGEGSDAGSTGFSAGTTRVTAWVEKVTPAAARVEIVAPDAPFFVVSDLDDTLVITDVIHKRKLINAALFEDEGTQPPVPGMAALYQCIQKLAAPSPPQFALVSGSPIQYGPRIAALLSKNGFPFLGLYLRELSPSTLENYKQPVIRQLMKQLPNRVVFFGDSGEHDPEVYAQMRSEFGDRVLRTYIRDAGHSENKARFDGAFFFHQASEAAFDAVEHHLADPECVKQSFPK